MAFGWSPKQAQVPGPDVPDLNRSNSMARAAVTGFKKGADADAIVRLEVVGLFGGEVCSCGEMEEKRVTGSSRG